MSRARNAMCCPRRLEPMQLVDDTMRFFCITFSEKHHLARCPSQFIGIGIGLPKNKYYRNIYLALLVLINMSMTSWWHCAPHAYGKFYHPQFLLRSS